MEERGLDVIADGKVVGRILESGSRFDPPDLLWTWSITSIWAGQEGRDERHSRDARTSDGQVSVGVGSGVR